MKIKNYLFAFWLSGTPLPAYADDPLLKTAAQELERAHQLLSTKQEPAYWIGLGISDVRHQNIRASYGALYQPQQWRRRFADIDVRVGNFKLDNTHQLRDAGMFNEEVHFSSLLPLEDNSFAIRASLWRSIDEAYRAGRRRLIKIRSNNIVKVELEDQSDDFSAAPPTIKTEPIKPFSLQPKQRKKWLQEIKSKSGIFREYPNIIDSSVSLQLEDETFYVVNTEGTKVRHQRIHHRLSIWAKAIATDGMELETYDYVDSKDLQHLPTGKALEKMVRQTAKKAEALRVAPMVDPYVGPAILRGRAAAVFFHEILGHRVEGHRQKDEEEGQTLTDKVGQQIFPSFISVIDDPTLQKWDKVDLNGHYLYDDEGSPAERVEVVKDGILKSFLLGRAPIEGFPKTNGHGRRDIGHAAVARQGNLIVSASQSVPYPVLRKKLIQLIKKQKKPFGLIFDDISGGFTFTGRNTPNSYNVKPVTVWKVYPDGRPDQLVRGVDMIGTPLLTFGRIAAASKNVQVFNGSCGAESGWVPVSAIAPDLLITEVEVQRKEKSNDRPPLLAPPKSVKP